MERWRRLAARTTSSGATPAGGRGRWGMILAGLGVAAVVSLAVVWLAASPRMADQADGRAVEVPLPPVGEPAPASPTSATTTGDPAKSQPHVEPLTDVVPALPDQSNGLTVPAVTAAAFATIPLAAPEAALPAAPEPALSEDTDFGLLPRRGADGRLPWRAYARPVAADEARPRVAIVVTGLGLSDTATSEIIRRLPGAVTLAFSPAAADAAGWARAARAAGHEILVALPVQGRSFPFVDKGPDALDPDAAGGETDAPLKYLLARMAGYVGVLLDTDDIGVAAASAGPLSPQVEDVLAAVSAEAAARGLLVVADTNSGTGSTGGDDVPRVVTDMAVASGSETAAIRARFAALEALARSRGHAVGVVEPSPLAVAELAAWSASLNEKDLVLVPVSAVALAAASLEP